MSYFIAGSHALVCNLPMVNRKPKDLDVFLPDNAEPPELLSENHIEYHRFPNEVFDFFLSSDGKHLDLRGLYVLKLSHSEYNIHWEKTVNDIAVIKKHLCITSYLDLDPIYVALFRALKKHWKIKHVTHLNGRFNKNINLDTAKDSFFTDKVTRKYDHDDLHRYVAYGDRPFYQKILKENQEVMIDKVKFNALSYEDKLCVCREEITVIAIERFLIPNYDFQGYYRWYRMALKKVVTSMTTGWFPTFIVENYPNLIKADPHCFNKMKNFNVDFDTKSSKIRHTT